MCRVLDEYGVTDPSEREQLRSIWWAMAGVEGQVRDRQKEKEKAAEERDADGKPLTQRPRRRPRT